MRGDYTLEHLSYGIHKKGERLVYLFEATSNKYTGKDKYHRTGLTNLWPGSCGQLMEPRVVKQDIHNLGAQANNTEN